MIAIFEQEQSIDKLMSSMANELAEFLAACQAGRKPAHEAEEGLFHRLMKAGGKALQWYLDQAGNGDRGPTQTHQNKVLKRSLELHARPYRSIFGVLHLDRYVYAERAGQKIELAFPDRELGLPDGEQSYVLESWVNRLTSHVSYDTAVTWLRETLEIHTTVRAAETMAAKASAFVAGYRALRPAPPKSEEAELLVLTADGKGVPMRRPLEQRLNEELGKKPHKRPVLTDYKKAKRRAHRGEKKVRKQVAYVGAAYTIDRWPRSVTQIVEEVCRRAAAEDRPEPQHKRLWAEMTHISNGQEDRGRKRLFEYLAREAAARDPRQEKTWVVLLDGDSDLWLASQKYLPRAIGILDLYHVLEKLWKASYCFHPESSQPAEDFVTHYLQLLLEGKVSSVIGVFRRFLKQQHRCRGKTSGLQKAIDYFVTNRQVMRYDEYLRAGYPIGSGVAEGACRHVVKDRMENTGMRWEIEGAQAILNLRTTYLSDEWSTFTKHRIETEQAALSATAA